MNLSLRSGAIACWLAGAALLSCRRAEQAPALKPSASPAVLTASSAPIVPAASASEPSHTLQLDAAKTTALQAVGDLLYAWNTALNAHDPNALEKLYAPSLTFYDREAARDEVVRAKRAAFAAAPAFEQRISDVRYEPTPSGGASAEFVKESGTKPRLAHVRGKLVVEARDGAFAIVVETDLPSEARAAARLSCLDAGMQVASALPEVKKVLAEAGPDAAFGGVTYSEAGANASAGMGFNHDDHFELVFGIEITNGALTISQYGTPLRVSAQKLAEVKAACSRSAR